MVLCRAASPGGSSLSVIRLGTGVRPDRRLGRGCHHAFRAAGRARRVWFCAVLVMPAGWLVEYGQLAAGQLCLGAGLADQRPRLCRAGGAGCLVVLAVDEHVAGLVGDAGDRRGLRVAGAGRGDAAGRVEAEHLDGAGGQSGGGAGLGGVQVQLGDVAGAAGVRGDDRAGDRAAVRCLPLRRAGGWLDEGVVDAAAQVRVGIALGEGERAAAPASGLGSATQTFSACTVRRSATRCPPPATGPSPTARPPASTACASCASPN
jgi:hypothetical protein